MRIHYSTHRITVSTIIIMISLMFAGMADLARAADPKYGGTLRFVGEVDAFGFDALKARALVGPGRVVGNLVMEKLFNRGKSGELIPVLGLSTTSSVDG